MAAKSSRSSTTKAGGPSRAARPQKRPAREAAQVEAQGQQQITLSGPGPLEGMTLTIPAKLPSYVGILWSRIQDRAEQGVAPFGELHRLVERLIGSEQIDAVITHLLDAPDVDEDADVGGFGVLAGLFTAIVAHYGVDPPE